MKTSELKGAALDWAVAECEGWEIVPNTHRFNEELIMFKKGEECQWFVDYDPSTDWAQGGPIIERERIAVEFVRRDEVDSALVVWSANKYGTGYDEQGPTPLIAAMRCYVTSRLGDEVEIPEELK